MNSLAINERQTPQPAESKLMYLVVRSMVLVTLLAEVLVSQSHAQVVQLPSISTFSYSGTVLVPDSGSAYLGGRYAAASSSQRRLGSRAAGLSIGVSGASVHATIIDLNAMDRAILGADPSTRSAPGNDRRQATIAERNDEGKQIVRFARAQFRRGNQGAAYDAYRMAINVLQGDLRAMALAEFQRVFPIASVQVATRR